MVGEKRPLVELEPSNPEWPGLYRREAQRISSILGQRVVLIEHVGSTSVPGLRAKPIIDILLEVESSAEEPAYLPDLAQHGYSLKLREPSWHEHRLFKGPDTDINLHVFSRGCAESDRMLSFRDQLRGDLTSRRVYEQKKIELASRSWRSTQDYADAKSDVIEEILTTASRLQP